MVRVGDFVQQANSDSQRILYKPIPSAKFKWPGTGVAPKDSPKCGFQNELCQKPLEGGKGRYFLR